MRICSLGRLSVSSRATAFRPRVWNTALLPPPLLIVFAKGLAVDEGLWPGTTQRLLGGAETRALTDVSKCEQSISANDHEDRGTCVEGPTSRTLVERARQDSNLQPLDP